MLVFAGQESCPGFGSLLNDNSQLALQGLLLHVEGCFFMVQNSQTKYARGSLSVLGLVQLLPVQTVHVVCLPTCSPPSLNS